MKPGTRALLAHSVGYIAGVAAAWVTLYLLGAVLLRSGQPPVWLLALVALAAGGAGFAAWSAVVTRMLGLRADRRWWGLGLGAVGGVLVLGTGLIAAGLFPPPEALILVLLLLFALGGWATHGRATGR